MTKRPCTTMEEYSHQKDFEFNNNEPFATHIDEIVKRYRLPTVEEQILDLKKHMVKSAREKGSKMWMNAYHVRPEVVEHFRKHEKITVEQRRCRCLAPCKHSSREYYKFYFLNTSESEKVNDK